MTRKKSHFQEKEPFLEKVLQLLRFHKVLPYVKKDFRVLDVGCGYQGALLKLLSSNISEGVGVDVSVTKKLIASNIRLVSQKKAILLNNHFDLVTCLAVIEHLEKPEKLLTSTYKSLKKDGKLLITTPSPIAKPLLEFMAFKLGVISKQEIKDHKKYYTRKELQDLLISSGFKSNKTKINHFFFGLNIFASAEK